MYWVDPQLGKLNETDIITIKSLEVEAQCQFVLNKQQIQLSSSQDLHVTLQIKGNFLIQVSKVKNSPQLGFKFKEGFSFRRLEISSKAVQRNNLYSSLIYNPILGFKIYFGGKLWLSFYKRASVSVQHFNLFLKVLSKKYIREKRNPINFQPKMLIGVGSTCMVYKSFQKNEKNYYAIKVIKKQGYLDRHITQKNFQRQFQILTQLQHKNLIKYFYLYDNQDKIFIVTQVLLFNLRQFLQKRKKLNIKTTKYIVTHIIKGLQQLKMKRIIHRDIKFENIMFRKQNDKIVPVIIDFGLSTFTSQKKKLKNCGTPGYIGPEILNPQISNYDQACDMFSVGVILYIMIFKSPPFVGANIKQIIEKNARCQIDFDSAPFHQLVRNENCLDFLKRILEKDPNKRLTPTQALSHPFLTHPGFTQQDQIQVAKILNEGDTIDSITY